MLYLRLRPWACSYDYVWSLDYGGGGVEEEDWKAFLKLKPWMMDEISLAFCAIFVNMNELSLL